MTRRRRDILLCLLFALATLCLALVPTGFERPDAGASVRCRAVVMDVDNTELQHLGLIRKGEQTVILKLREGPYEGRIVEGLNQLMGMMDRDKIFRPGDEVLAVLSLDKAGNIIFVNPQAHYRLGLEALLLGLFACLLCAFAGWTGAKALLSFLFSAVMIWKVLVPLLLRGMDPILVTLAVVAVLCAAVIFLVAGLTRKGVVACLGSLLGVGASCLLSLYFTHALHLHGAVQPFAETLLYSGFQHLDLTRILAAAVCLGASGAVMDLAMDVAASMDEVVKRNPDISRREALASGLRVGRAVVGTMTTTLLLAYSGSYVTLLMAFMAQGVPPANILNLVYVAAEIFRTLAGSFGLVAVAPFTALCGAMILARHPSRRPLTAAAPPRTAGPLAAQVTRPTVAAEEVSPGR